MERSSCVVGSTRAFRRPAPAAPQVDGEPAGVDESSCRAEPWPPPASAERGLRQTALSLARTCAQAQTETLSLLLPCEKSSSSSM